MSARGTKGPQRGHQRFRRLTRDEMVTTRQAFRTQQVLMDMALVDNPPMDTFVPRLRKASRLPAAHIRLLLRYAGIVDPLEKTLTDDRIQRFFHALTDMTYEQVEASMSASQASRRPERPAVTPLVEPRFPGQEHLAAARAVFRSVLEQQERRSAPDPVFKDLNRRIANALELSLDHAKRLLESGGIADPLSQTLTQARIDRFINTAYSSPARYPVPEPIRDGEKDERARQRKAERRAARAARDAAEAGTAPDAVETGRSSDTPPGPKMRYPDNAQQRVARQVLVQTYLLFSGPADFGDLVNRLAVIWRFPEADVVELLREHGASENEHPRLLTGFLEPLMDAAAHHGVPAGTPTPRRRNPQPTARTTARPPAEPVERLSRQGLQQVAAPRARQVASPAPAAAQAAPRRRTSSYPACRRLVDGLVGGTAAHTTADYYLALAELSAYRSTAQAAAVAEIAGDRFGIHTDAGTGYRLNERAARLCRTDEAGAQLDHLSRLDRRLRGVLYDGHRDRITAWDSSGNDMELYTCTGAELRAAAAAAVDYGDLTIPSMRHQVVTDLYLPTGVEDPALVLAVAAEQLGRQAARTVVQAPPSATSAKVEEMPRAGTGTAPSGTVRTVSASTWVHPVSGDWGELVVGHLDASYTRHTPGERSRAATVVCEHKRRAPGTPKTAEPTITVKSHPRRGSGPEAPAPKVTKVGGRRELWR